MEHSESHATARFNLTREFQQRIGYGQGGVQVIWDRVIYPGGSSLDLSGMIGQDAHDYSGFRNKVDRQYKRLAGFAVLTSLFAAASEISQNENRSLLTYPSPAQVVGSAGQQRPISGRKSQGETYTFNRPSRFPSVIDPTFA